MRMIMKRRRIVTSINLATLHVMYFCHGKTKIKLHILVKVVKILLDIKSTHHASLEIKG